MSEYILIMIWLAFMALFQHFVNTRTTIVIHGKKRNCVTLWYAILVFAPLVWFAVNRGRGIGDTSTYINTYKNMPSSFSQLPDFYNELGKDKWFYMFEALIRIILSKDYRVCFFVIAFFQAFSLVRLYRRYTNFYLVAVYIFVACGDAKRNKTVCSCLYMSVGNTVDD